MPPANNAQQSAQQQMQMNLAQRALLLQTGTPMKKLLGVFGPYQLGQNVQIPLDRMGVFTDIELSFTANVTIANAAATQTPAGLHSLVSQVKYTDFNAVDRVNCPGPFLFAQNSIKAASLYAEAFVNQNQTGTGAVDTNQYFQPTAVGANQTAFFRLDVPLAYMPKSDLRGSVLAQTVVGDHYIKLQFANAASSTAAAPDQLNTAYTAPAGNVTVNNIFVTVHENYIQPQNLSMLPVIDLSTIYGLEGGYVSTANLAPNTPFFINYPNNRSILRTYFVYENNGILTPNGTDLGEIDLIANANTLLRQETTITLRTPIRNLIDGDLMSGLYIFDTSSTPIATTLYGNVQVKANVIAANTGAGPTLFSSMFEDFYPAGVPLPGVATGY